jgi:hypothetical protein
VNTDVETRLRAHFARAPFRPTSAWEGRVMRNATLLSPSAFPWWASAIATRRGRLASVAVLAIVGMLSAFTAMPAAAGPNIPEWVIGLRNAVHIDSTGSDRATSWGTTLEVVGAYLDDQRTIVVLRGGTSQLALSNAYLVANGQRHGMQEVVSGEDGYYALKFESLPEALSSGVAVTLRLASFPARIWTLSFTIGPRVIATSSIPLPGSVGKMVITFTSISTVPGAFAIRFTETGLTYDEVLGPVQISNSGGIQMTGHGPLTVHVQVFDRTGKPLRWLDTQLTPATDATASVSFSVVSLRTGPGPYRIVITGPDGDALERTVGA